MANFYVNGKNYSVNHEEKLIRYLRDTLHLTSVKDGCSEGACGTCTVIIDGEPQKACTFVTSELEGKHITTVEGLSEYEKEVYVYAFGHAGAVQCGFCIPGMVMCAKALLDRNSNPDEKIIRHAIRNNICRCTGYVKIVKAIQLAAEIFRGEKIMNSDSLWTVGSSIPRLDAGDKVTGKGLYPDDIYIDGMLHVAAVRSKYPRARVISIDSAKALNTNGVVRIITASDIPGTIKVGHILRDWDTMIPEGEITRYVGDVIALVVAESREIAVKATGDVKVEYEVLQPVTDPYEAMAPDAPLIHEGGNLLGHTFVNRGNVDEELRKADFVIKEKYSTPWTEHAFMEPEAAVAVPMDDGGVKIYSTDQGVYDTRRETAPMLGLPEEKVRVENCYVGGGFGGKEDVSVQHLAALAALLTNKPCKMKLSRSESLAVHPKRHPMDMTLTMGCDKNGIIKALDAKVITDNGAYASLGLPVLQRACTHASGPYNYQNFRVDGKAYYTNNPPAGAFRGFGVTQTCFAVESLLNRMADKIGISHWEIRYRNAIRPGQELPNGQIADSSTGLAETLEKVRDIYESSKYAGIACALKNAGVGVGLPDTGRVRILIKNGKAEIHSAGSCIGQGLFTVLKQTVCSAANLPGNKVTWVQSNTYSSPDSGTTSGSRHTTITGEAARRAAVLLRQAIDENGSLEALEGREFYAEYLAKTDPFGSDVKNPVSHVAYGYAVQVCILDEESHKISRIVSAHDVGKAINPLNVEGQIEGGTVMGMGFALKEKYRLEKCIPTAHFASLGLFMADEVPEIIPIIVEKPGLEISNGAIGIGEITSIPTAPAIADAYSKIDGIYRTQLPLTQTPYENNTDERKPKYHKQKCLTVNTDARCIACQQCVIACSSMFFKTENRSMAFLHISQIQGMGNKSGIFGKLNRPSVCIQCGICADVCQQGAIRPNLDGVFIVDKKLCTGCGTCIDACPVHVMVLNPETKTASKCIACGRCAKACSMGVLSVEKG